jgi:hypothetical protein
MTKVNKDDIAAITSRMDAAITVLIEVLAEANGLDVDKTRSKYTKRYDAFATKFREKMITEDGKI